MDNIKDNKWNFPGNGYSRDSGLDTPDMETFKKDPISSLAREICQNSIDAVLDSDNPVRVDFSLFTMKTEDIPDKGGLLFQINQGIKYRENSANRKETEINRLKKMQELLKQKEVRCLRISDFNTTGLRGVKNNDSTSPFYMLTKGSGISYKDGTSGGSKGIGKYASFVVSQVHTLFYSTYTIDKESGFLGIAKIGSGIKADENLRDTDELTIGEGYFGSNIKNEPLEITHSLDSSFVRNDNQTGTDIFVIAFDEEDYWQNAVTVKILESFIVAIYRGKLEVLVDNKLLNKETLKEIVFSNIYQNVSTSTQNLIKSQYILLSDNTVYSETLTIGEYGDVEVKIKDFSNESNEHATKKCVFIRYPYMKIKETRTLGGLPFSAMAIIGDNELNQTLRKFENPQHTDWELGRKDYSKEERKEAKSLYDELYYQICNLIKETLSNTQSEETDVEGAEEYLPDESNTAGGMISTAPETADKPTIRVQKKKKSIDNYGYSDDDDGESLQPDLGEESEDGDSRVNIPEGQNQDRGGDNRPGENEENNKEGQDEILKIVELSGIKYRFISLSPSLGKYAVKFKYVEDEKNCSLRLRLLDDVGKPDSIAILDASQDGRKLTTRGNEIMDISIKANTTNIVELTVDQNEMFSGEVKIYAYR